MEKMVVHPLERELILRLRENPNSRITVQMHEGLPRDIIMIVKRIRLGLKK